MHFVFFLATGPWYLYRKWIAEDGEAISPVWHDLHSV
jgi:hypothetical protein